MNFSIKNIRKISQLIQNHIKKTPLQRSQELEKLLNVKAKIYLKLENTQQTGSFKVRGALNAILALSPEKSNCGVITSSSGNFAIGLSYAGSILKVKTTIVMPETAPDIKKKKSKKYNAEVILKGKSHEEAEEIVKKIKLERPINVISSYNHEDVIKGQGTIALEIFDELPTITHLYAPIGGGGLLSGCGMTFKLLNPSIEVIGVEPEGAHDYYLSFRQEKLVTLEKINTIADGLRAVQVGNLNKPILDQCVDKVITVPDNATIEAMKLIWNYYHFVLEPSGAVALAALLENPPFEGNVACILTGSNIDPQVFESYIKQAA